MTIVASLCFGIVLVVAVLLPPPEVRSFLPWAGFALTWIAGLGGLTALHPRLRAAASPLVWRAPLLIAGGVSLAVVGAVVVYALVDNFQRTASDATASADAAVQRDADDLAAVTAMDPVADFAELLRHANIFNPPSVRTVVARKLASHPALIPALVERIAIGGCDDALVFLEGGNVPGPEVLAQPVDDAIRCMARRSATSCEARASSTTTTSMRIPGAFWPWRVASLPWTPIMSQRSVTSAGRWMNRAATT